METKEDLTAYTLNQEVINRTEIKVTIRSVR